MKPDSYREPDPRSCGDCIWSKRIWDQKSKFYGTMMCTFGQQTTVPTTLDIVHPEGNCDKYSGFVE